MSIYDELFEETEIKTETRKEVISLEKAEEIIESIKANLSKNHSEDTVLQIVGATTQILSILKLFGCPLDTPEILEAFRVIVQMMEMKHIEMNKGKAN